MKSAKKTIALAAAMLLAATGLALAQNYRIDWYTTDSGGALKTDSIDDGQWQVSGTAGQWDATEPRANSGIGWELTGGFWALTLEDRAADLIFLDGFEEDEPN